jgi:hypothetical protein
MRKSQAAAFGTRGIVSTAPAIQAPIPELRWKPSNTAATIRYGLIIKIAIALWVMTILVMMLWVR